MSSLISVSMVLMVAWMFIASAREAKTGDADQPAIASNKTAAEKPLLKANYHKISANEAKEILAKNSNAILVDVRTETEYKEKRIEGALLIPDFEIAESAEEKLPDKEDVILVYCRSGKRSESASKKLVSLGYTNVYDFGGINTYPHATISG